MIFMNNMAEMRTGSASAPSSLAPQNQGQSSPDGGLFNVLTAVAAQTPATDASSGTTVNVADLSAKIAATLKAEGGDITKLIQQLQTLLTTTSQDQLSQKDTQAQTGQSLITQVLKGVLTQLQSAQSMSLAQPTQASLSHSPSQTAARTQDLSTSLAQLLQDVAAQQDQPVVREAKSATEDKNDVIAAATPSLEKFTQDIRQFLHEQGFSDADAQKYVNNILAEAQQNSAQNVAQATPSVIKAASPADMMQAVQNVRSEADKAADDSFSFTAPRADNSIGGHDNAARLDRTADSADAHTSDVRQASASRSALLTAQADAGAQKSDSSLAASLTTAGWRTQSHSDGAGYSTYTTNLKEGTQVAAQTYSAQAISLQIQKNAQSGVQSMTVQLSPVELGKLEIRIKFDKGEGLKAHVIADRPETMALLQKDAGMLERTLQQAGFKLDSNALSFDLHQGGNQYGQEAGGTGQDASRGQQGSARGGVENATESGLPDLASIYSGYITSTGVNICV